MSSLVYGAQTQTTVNTANGLQIFYPEFDYIPKDQSFNLHIHINNITTGKEVLNTFVNCSIHIYNGTGNHILESNLSKDSNLIDHEIYILGSNFSSYGKYSFKISCMANSIGGSISNTFVVNNKGVEPTIAQAGFYFIVILMVVIFLFISLYAGLNIPYSNKTNMNGDTIQINWKKYLKIFSLGMAYVFSVALTFITWSIIYAYSDWVALSTWLRYIYTLELIVALPLLVGGFIFILIKYVNERNLQKFIDRMGSAPNG